MGKPKKNTEQYILEVTQKVCLEYDYSETVYTHVKNKINIRCPRHDYIFSCLPPLHLRNQAHCPFCAKEISSAKRTLTQLQFEERVVAAHGLKYDITKSVYRGFKEYVSFICSEHGEKTIRAGHFMAGRGCVDCSNMQVSQKYTKTKQEWIDGLTDIQQIGLYDYTDSKYISARDPIEIFCNVCNSTFWQLPSNHSAGSGCSNCYGPGGFRTEHPGSLYIFGSKDFIKVGITNKEVNKRISCVNKKAPSPFSVLSVVDFKSGAHAAKLEAEILKELRSIYGIPNLIFDGYTECFPAEYHENILAIISKNLDIYKEFYDSH